VGNPLLTGGIVSAGNGFDVSGGGQGVGGTSDQFQFAWKLVAGDFDLAVRIDSFGQSDAFAQAGLMAREDLTSNCRFASVLATPSMNGAYFDTRTIAGGSSASVGKVRVNYPNTWLRVQRSTNLFNGYASYDGVTWQKLGSSVFVTTNTLYVGMVVCSHNSAAPALAQFRDFTQVTNALSGTLSIPHEPLGPCSRLTPFVISEIMYKPAPRADTNNVEFIELYNSNPFFEDLSGFQIAGGSVSYTFPRGSILNGGAFLVVAASPQGIRDVYGITNVTGPYSGSLKKAGTIQLIDAQGGIVLTVPYSNLQPWPVATDGTGHSLVLANPTYGEGDPRAWDISDVIGGSPGHGDAFQPRPLRSVLINEVLAHSENPAVPQFVELYNHGNQTNDLSGCVLTDSPDTNRFIIPPGTLIGPGGFVSFDRTQLGFDLNGAGGTLYFINPDHSRFLDALQFQPEADGVSYGRWPDGANDFYALASATPKDHNSAIWIGDIVINELMYAPISGNDDDQYIELFNKGTNIVNLGNWQFNSGITFTFPANVTLAPNSYLVLARSQTNLFARYPNLNPANTLGNYGGKLSHKGETLSLLMPQLLRVNGSTNTIYVVEDEVTYAAGGRWGQWSHGGGSSLELINPNTNHRLAYNWADSDETAKSVWTNLEFTGVLDNGNNYSGSAVDLVQLGLMDVGECLVDDVEVLPGGPTGANIVSNGSFESGLSPWIVLGDHVRSSLETAFGGYQSATSLHLRSTDSVWTLADCAQGTLTQTTLGAGQTATLRLKARWLRGWPEILMRLRGNWLEVAGAMPLPANLGTPGLPNSRAVANAGPAIYEIKHSPALPVAGQPVVITARFHDLDTFQPTLLYRIDTGANPAPTYTSVAMADNGTAGDALAADGIYSATIPAQSSGKVVAFLVQARDSKGVTTVFPQVLNNNAGVPRECVIGFGDPIPTGSFSHHHIFLTQNWAQRWSQGGGVSHEAYDGTWVDGGGRIIYDWQGRYAGSPYHQYLGSPVGTVGGMHWDMPDDDQVFGTTSFNKQHVPGNNFLDDKTIQREQASFWMARQIGLRFENRRYYFCYVNGVRHAPLMEDAQVPGSELIKEFWPNDSNGMLYKNHSWFEGDTVPQSNAYMNFNNKSWCSLGRYTTTINGVPNQYKLARYRWVWTVRQYQQSANDFSQVLALIDAANTPRTSPAYYANMENQVDTEEWLRLSAMEHATGDWDSFFTQNQWNMYNYKPTLGKWTALKWDWNITLNGGSTTWPSDGSQLFNFTAYDPIMAAFHNYPPYQRAYLRALQDIANLAMNNAMINPMLDAKYATFVANGLTTSAINGLTVQEPGADGLKTWIGQMHDSILAALASRGVSNVPFTITSEVTSNNTEIVSGTAPLQVKTIWFNGTEFPVTWSTVTGWTVTVPLKTGTNLFSVTGVDLTGQPVSGSSNFVSVVYSAPSPSPASQVVLNEIMYHPAVPNAGYVELYNNSAASTFDLSGWELQGAGYTFPAGSILAPNSYMVLAENRWGFTEAYGGSHAIFDTLTTPLSVTGQNLLLMQPGAVAGSNLLVAGVQYGSSAPWPAGSNNVGSSLQLIDSRQDNWRVGNWATLLTNSPAQGPQWQYVTITGTAPKPILLVCMHGTAGDVYVDDLKLVAGSVPEAGANLIQNGDFETPLSGPWTVSANMVDSEISTQVKHSGNSSLHVIASSPGDAVTDAIWENTDPITTNGTYTLSYWYLPSSNGTQALLRLSGTSPGSGQIYSLQDIQLPIMGSALFTPGTANSTLATLPQFPALWLNELQADNLSGITNSLGQHVPWLELYNPTTNAVSLTGLYLSTNYANLTAWMFPAGGVVNPGEFKIIFADGQTSLSIADQPHTSFALASRSGSLALSRLYNGQPQVLDYIDYTNISANHSYGSVPDGQSFFRQELASATPGATNDAAIPPSFIAYTSPGMVYTQNFDGLPDPGAASVNSDNPVTINGVTYSLGNPFGFADLVLAGGNGGLGITEMAGWYGRATLSDKFGATDGDQTTGGQISFGLPGSANRALGLLATSSTASTAFGARFINQTAQTLNSLTIQVTGELWRQSNLPKTLQSYYFIDLSGEAPFSGSRTAFLPGLNLSFPVSAAAVGGTAVDGTAAINQVNLNVANQAIADWPPGAALWLVWQMTDLTGKAQGLGIDNLSFSASAEMSQPPLPLSFQTTATNLVLVWTGIAGQSYQVEYTDDLEANTWTPEGLPIAGTGATLTFTNDFTKSSQRFYRLSILP
jgi:regulation of enolase protein 1 (concanavalin A-like superfamily)